MCVCVCLGGGGVSKGIGRKLLKTWPHTLLICVLKETPSLHQGLSQKGVQVCTQPF